MIGPVFSGLVWTWPHQLAVLLVISFLTFYSVYVRARWARRERGPFPTGSLALCSCLILGFALGVTHRGDFGDYVVTGLFVGILVGSFFGMIAMASRAVVKKAPTASSPVGVWDRDLDL